MRCGMEDLGKEIFVGSGAIGTVLRQGQNIGGGPVELLNLNRPEAVRTLHQAYRDAGSRILLTNTFAANALSLAEAGAEALCRAVNRAGVSLARETAGNACLVWASVGPLSLGLRHDDFTTEQLTALYEEQCKALTGADALVLETFIDPREARAALGAATATGLPVIFQVGHTGRGQNRWTAIDVLLAEAEAAKVTAVGTNCQHPDDIVEVASYLLSRTGLPVTASANAGHPSIDRGLVHYELTPDDLRTVAKRLANLGVAVIGGCCGTTPDHIRAIAPMLQERPVEKAKGLALRSEVAPATAPRRVTAANRVRDLIQSDRFLISVEIRADRNTGLDALCRQADSIAAAGADLFDVPDNPGATVGRDAAITAARLQDSLKVPALFHRAVTQANLLQIHSSLLGAWDLGLKGLLALTGDPPTMGPLAALTRRVTDLKSSVELLRLVRLLREGTLINGDAVADPPDFCAGATVGWSAPAQLAWLRKKIEAGAEFVFSQPLFSAEDYCRLRDSVASLGVRFFPGLLPLLSQRNAAFFASGRIPGIRVPKGVVDAFSRYASAPDQRKLGLDLAYRQADTMAAEGQGIYLIMPFGAQSFTETAALVRHLRVRRPR